ncbi:MAG: FecR family protein [Burkholderiales bacterium]
MKNGDPNRFRLSQRGVMFALVSAALSQAALANTGRVDFAIGNVVVTGANGQARALAKGAEVGTGDKIASGADGRAQIRFSDGAYVSLQPNTEFDIKQYRYNGKTDGTESALFGLFKGALRTVTGLVGRINKNRYLITTPTATIGIRGTGGLISIGGDGSTLVTGTSGIWLLSNNGGSLDVPAGTAGFAGANVNVPPQPSTEPPVLPPPPPPPSTTIIQGDVVNSQGNPVSIAGPAVLTSGPGFAVGSVITGTAVAGITSAPLSSASTTVFNASGQLTQFTNTALTTTISLAAGGTHNDFGTDGVLAWDRWTGTVNSTTGGVTTPTIFSATQGLHTVVGLPTPTASMPSGTTFTYNLIGATSPTLVTGAGASSLGTFSAGTLVGDFINNKVGLSMTVTAATGTYNIATTGFALGAQNPNGLAIGGSGFGGTISTFGTLTCSGGCTTTVTGGFAGTGATHAGLVYQISEAIGNNTISGAAAFMR